VKSFKHHKQRNVFLLCWRHDGESDNDNGKWHKYVCITTNQPDTESNHITLNQTNHTMY